MSGVAKSYQNTKESPQDAEAVARPDLTAETLAMLDTQQKRHAKNGERSADWYAHAAACVREVAALRAIATSPSGGREAMPSYWLVLRDDNAVLGWGKTRNKALEDALSFGFTEAGNRCVAVFEQWPPVAPVPPVVTEAMVEAAARAQYELEHTDLPWERCGSLFADGYREDARAVLTAALAARGEGE